MESALGFYANKPLVVCCCGRILGFSKQEAAQVRRSSQEMSGCGGGEASALRVFLPETWLAAAAIAAVYYLR